MFHDQGRRQLAHAPAPVKKGDKLVRVSIAYDASSALTTLLVSLVPNAPDS